MKGDIRYILRRKWLISLILASLLIISSMQVTILANGQPSPPVPTSMTLTADPEYIPINGSTSTITATVYDQNGDPCGALVWFSNSGTSLGTLRGYKNKTFDNGTRTYNYTDSNTGIATAILTSGATPGTEIVRAWIGGTSVAKTVEVEFTPEEETPPSVTNPSAIPDIILNDNGRGRAAGTNVSRINVTVTDDAGVANVAIDLSPIGGSATQPMERIEGTDIWTVRTNASSGINVTNYLLVNATDIYSKSNDTVSVPLEVLRRGDVKRDNAVNMEDMMYIARYTVGLEPEASNPPSVLVGDVVGAGGDPRGDGKVDMKDALYIARWVAGLEQEP